MKRHPSTKHAPRTSTAATRDPMQGRADAVRPDALTMGLAGTAAPAGARNPLVPLVRQRKAGAHEDRRAKERLRQDQSDSVSARLTRLRTRDKA